MSKVATHWSSRFAFILASAGAAVGLGNIWRFPYIAGENGGGAFVLVYIGFVIVLGIPLMMSEVLVGRRGNQNAASSFRSLALQNNSSKFWMIGGALPIIAGFLILSYYSVVSGWVCDFLYYSIFSTFKHLSVGQISNLFDNLLGDPMLMLFWDTLMIAAIILILARGIHKGLEKTVYFMFPALAVLIVVLIIYSFNTGSFNEGFNFLFKPNFHDLTPHGVLLALGQAFFSLSIGTGIMLTYGKYVSKETSIMRTCIIVVFADTLVALLAGLAIFPIIFANGLEPSAGPSLIFKTLPVAFSQMHFGDFFSALFFLMLLFAAFTSAIALLEPTILWLMEKYDFSRAKAATSAGFVLWVVSLGSVASFNIGAQFKIFGMTFFDLLDTITSNIMLPLNGLIVALFTGWIIHKQDTRDEFQLHTNSLSFRSWRFVARYIAPVAILLIFLNAVGLF